jgi:hypothetical protein
MPQRLGCMFYGAVSAEFLRNGKNVVGDYGKNNAYGIEQKPYVLPP